MVRVTAMSGATPGARTDRGGTVLGSTVLGSTVLGSTVLGGTVRGGESVAIGTGSRGRPNTLGSIGWLKKLSGLAGRPLVAALVPNRAVVRGGTLLSSAAGTLRTTTGALSSPGATRRTGMCLRGAGVVTTSGAPPPPGPATGRRVEAVDAFGVTMRTGIVRRPAFSWRSPCPETGSDSSTACCRTPAPTSSAKQRTRTDLRLCTIGDFAGGWHGSGSSPLPYSVRSETNNSSSSQELAIGQMRPQVDGRVARTKTWPTYSKVGFDIRDPMMVKPARRIRGMRLTVVGCWLLAICLICDPVSAQPTLIGARSCIAHAAPAPSPRPTPWPPTAAPWS